MIVILVFAFISGVVTILSPCILPVLPILLSGTVGGGKARPAGVVAGFAVTFTVFTLALSALIRALGISSDLLRLFAVAVLVLFGLVMLVPRLQLLFERFASRLARRSGTVNRGAAGKNAQGQLAGFGGGVAVGFSLGVVWTPCVGPIMASVISLAVTQQVDGGAVLITLAYTLGTSIPMLGVMTGGRALLTRNPRLAGRTAGIQRIFGVLMIVVGIAIGFGWDRQFQSAVLAAFPNYGAGLTALEDSSRVRSALDARNASLTPSDGSIQQVSFDGIPKNGRLGDYGAAPQLVANGPWLNSGGQSFSMEELRGKVVLVDFWTYSCVNCVRTLPYLSQWYETYRDQGFVIIGVHTPEFDFEKSPGNVAKAVRQLGVTWPVVMDNDYSQWRAYNNRYWPAHYFIDAEGRVRYYSFGEGHYDTSEKVIRALLKEAGRTVTEKAASMPEPEYTSRTPETYLGYSRADAFVSVPAGLHGETANYTVRGKPGNGEWGVQGRWTVYPDYVVPETAGMLTLGFDARNVFLVIAPGEDAGRIHVRVDGATPADTSDVHDGLLIPDESRLYRVVELKKEGRHTLQLDVHGNMKLFAFTFG